MSFNSRYNAVPGIDRLAAIDVGVVGLGSIGHTLALTLSCMGVRHLTVYDFDVVEEANVGAQGYPAIAIGCEKAAITRDWANDAAGWLCEPGAVRPHNGVVARGRFPLSPDKQGLHDVLFVCVDTMGARQTIADTRYCLPSLALIDTRVALFASHIIADVPPYDRWRATLFPDSDAADLPCGRQSIRHAAVFAAMLAIEQFRQALLPGFVPREVRAGLSSGSIGTAVLPPVPTPLATG